MALTGLIGEQLANVIVDRTCLDADGVRWIITYDAATGQDKPAEQLIAGEVARCRSQLERYVEFGRAVFTEPLRAAAYFTALPRLVEVESSY